MSDAYMKSYAKRVRKINKKHRKMGNGVVHSVNHDGLIIARPRRSGLRLPLGGMVLAILAFFAFKTFLLIYLGQATYNDRVNILQNGSFIEQAGAYVMSADTVTKSLATYVTSDILGSKTF